jgi:DNA primase
MTVKAICTVLDAGLTTSVPFRERVHIAGLFQARGVPVRLNGRGGGTALCPFHDDHRPSVSIYRSRRDDTERFRCWSCGSRGDAFDFAQTLLDYPDHTATLRALAAEHHLSWPEHHEPSPLTCWTARRSSTQAASRLRCFAT